MNDNSLHTSTSHEYYIDLDARIANLADRQAGFSDYIDRRWHDLSVRQLARLLRGHGQMAVRLGRLPRDRRGMGGVGGPPICIDDIIADLDDKLGRLCRDIDERWPELDSGNVKPWGRLVTVYSQNAVRLGQLMLARRALREDSFSGPGPGSGYGELDGAIDAAMDRVSEEWGVEL